MNHKIYGAYLCLPGSIACNVTGRNIHIYYIYSTLLTGAQRSVGAPVAMTVWPRHKGGRVVHVQQHKRKRRVTINYGIIKVFGHQPAKKRILLASIAQFNQGSVANRAQFAASGHAHIAGQLQAGQTGAHIVKQGFHVFKKLAVNGCGQLPVCQHTINLI